MPLFSCFSQLCRGGVEVLERRECGLTEIPDEALRWAGTLEELYLDSNLITDIPETLSRCRRLRVLSLAQNKLTHIPPFVGSLEAIEELHLEDNELDDLPRELGDCSRLKILDLRLNLFQRLPEVITKLNSLTHLHLFETSLTQLPADIGFLSNLRSLDVRENQLRALPPSIGDLKQLKLLDIGRNEILVIPSEIGNLDQLEELYADHNLLGSLPDSLVRCSQLQSIDVSHNDLTAFPEDLGDLEEIVELNFAENRVSSLPNSINRLKKMTTLKGESNALTTLNPAIGGCAALQEVYLSNNQLKSLPSSLGNLKSLDLLSLDDNQIAELPPTIGGCSALSILSLRSNDLKELPLEVGRLANLRVLDVCDNYLVYLPFTVNVLFNLRALWLSVDQTTPLTPLKTALDPGTRVKVLTCYLLPQGSGQEPRAPRNRREGNIRFEGDGAEGAGDGDVESLTGSFVRKGTPHPKQRARPVSPRRLSIDGRFIPHSEEECTEVTISLRRKSLTDISDHSATQSVFDDVTDRSAIVAEQGTFVPESVDGPKLERRISIDRNAVAGFGLTLAGGCDSEPFKGSDSGLFISRVQEGGASAIAGLLVGDKVIAVNGIPVSGNCHRKVARLMQLRNRLDLIVERNPPAEKPEGILEEHSTLQVQTSKSVEEGTLSTSIQRDIDGSLGFTVGRVEDQSQLSVVIASVEGAVERTGKIRVGDRVLSINGKNLSDVVDLDDALKVLSDDDSKEVFLVVRRAASAVPAADPSDAPSGTSDQSVRLKADAITVPSDTSDNSVRVQADLTNASLDKSDHSVRLQGNPMNAASDTSDQSVHSQADPISIVSDTSNHLVRLQADAINAPSDTSDHSVWLQPESSDDMFTKSDPNESIYAHSMIYSVSMSCPAVRSERPESPTVAALLTETIDSVATYVDSTTLCNESGAANESELTFSFTSTASSASRSAPPVAPKPKMRFPSCIAVERKRDEIVEPSRLDFSSKLKKFESAGQLSSGRSLGIPAKKRLLSEEDVKKMKEEEDRKVASTQRAVHNAYGDEDQDHCLQHILNCEALTRSAPAVVRTKNAERRMQQVLSPTIFPRDSNGSESRSDVEKRQMWRQARYKSIEAASESAERVMEQVREISTRLGNVPEEGDTQGGEAPPPLLLSWLQKTTPLVDANLNETRDGGAEDPLHSQANPSLGISA